MKKNILIFISGMLAMLAIIIIFGLTTNYSNGSDIPGLTISKEEHIIDGKQIVIFQTLEHDLALAHITNPKELFDHNKLLVLVIGDEKSSFYDSLKINISDDKCIKQIGTYQYESKLGKKTVPAIAIRQKDKK